MKINYDIFNSINFMENFIGCHVLLFIYFHITVNLCWWLHCYKGYV